MIGKLLISSAIALAAAAIITATMAIVGTDEYIIIASPIALMLLAVALFCYETSPVEHEKVKGIKKDHDQ